MVEPMEVVGSMAELPGRDDEEEASCCTSELMSMAERVLRGQHTLVVDCETELPANTEFWRERSRLR